MTALKAKWSEMSRYRRGLLIVMAIEILSFFFATLVMINRPGLEYQDALLYPRTEGELRFTRAGWTGKPPGSPSRRVERSPTRGGSTLTVPIRFQRTPPLRRRERAV